MEYLIFALCLEIAGVIVLYFAGLRAHWIIQKRGEEGKKKRALQRKWLYMGIIGLILVLIGYSFILILYLKGYIL